MPQFTLKTDSEISTITNFSKSELIAGKKTLSNDLEYISVSDLESSDYLFVPNKTNSDKSNELIKMHYARMLTKVNGYDKQNLIVKTSYSFSATWFCNTKELSIVSAEEVKLEKLLKSLGLKNNIDYSLDIYTAYSPSTGYEYYLEVRTEDITDKKAFQKILQSFDRLEVLPQQLNPKNNLFSDQYNIDEVLVEIEIENIKKRIEFIDNRLNTIDESPILKSKHPNLKFWKPRQLNSISNPDEKKHISSAPTLTRKTTEE